MSALRYCIVATICVLALSACVTDPSTASRSKSPLTLVSAFSGRSEGKGQFLLPIAGVDKTFRATLTGRFRANVFEVREDIRFSDGERQRLRWRFTKVSDGRWTGVREDVIGKAHIVERDGVIRLNYAAMVDSGDSRTRLQFADTVYRTADGKLVNTATISKFGLPVGSVRLVLSR